MKTRVKRIACLVACVALVCSMASTAGAAAVTPRFQRISSAFCALTISESGLANAGVKVTAYATDRMQGMVELKRFTNGGWENVATWSANATRSLNQVFSRYVLSGYTYKVFATVDVYLADGSYCESVNLESNEVFYT